MRYKYIDQFTPPQQITSVTINNVTTSTIYDSKSFDDLVDSIGIGKKFIPTEQPECDEGYYAKASYVDGDVITQAWEVMEVMPSKVDEIEVDVINTMNAVVEIYEMLL